MSVFSLKVVFLPKSCDTIVDQSVEKLDEFISHKGIVLFQVSEAGEGAVSHFVGVDVVDNAARRIGTVLRVLVKMAGIIPHPRVVVRVPTKWAAPSSHPRIPAPRAVIDNGVHIDSDPHLVAPADHGRELGLGSRASLQLVGNWLIPFPPGPIGRRDHRVLIGWRNLQVKAMDISIKTIVERKELFMEST